MNQNHELERLCTLVESALDGMRRRRLSPSEFWEPDNLWEWEISNTCTQILECYRGILVLAAGNLSRPAAALSRSIHEAYIRFVYLTDREDELRDWFEWQMIREYHSARESLEYDQFISADRREEYRYVMSNIHTLLEMPPTKRRFPWRPIGDMLNHIARDLPEGTDRQLKRHLLDQFSDNVHISLGGDQPLELTIGLAEVSIMDAMERAVRVITDKSIAVQAGDEFVPTLNRLHQVMRSNWEQRVSQPQ